MYHINGLWYAQVGNGTVQIDTHNRTPSICATKHNDLHIQQTPITPVPSEKAMDMDATAIGIVVQDNKAKHDGDTTHPILIAYRCMILHTSVKLTHGPPL